MNGISLPGGSTVSIASYAMEDGAPYRFYNRGPGQTRLLRNAFHPFTIGGTTTGTITLAPGDTVVVTRFPDSVIAHVENKNPYNYNVKFGGGGGQTSRTIDAPSGNVTYTRAQGEVSGSTPLIIPIVNATSVPNNVLADIPFLTRWEGALRVQFTGSGVRYTQIDMIFTHYVGIPNVEFPATRSAFVRILGRHDDTLPLAVFNSTVTLPGTTVARFPSADNQTISIVLSIRTFNDSNQFISRNPGLPLLIYSLEKPAVQFTQLARN